MPLLSDTMEEGVVAAWHKAVGDTVSIGDLMAEIETDKATMDFESPHDGVLLHIGVEEGNAIPVGALLAVVGEQGEDVSSLINGAASSQAASSESSAAVEEAPAAPQATPAEAPASSTSSADEAGRIKASPLARAMAKEAGIDLNSVQGTGENGRIVKRDIEALATGAQTAAPSAAPQAAPQVSMAPAAMPSDATGTYSEEKVSQMRKTIARRLAESKFSAPHFYVTMEIDMDNAIKMRKQLNEFAPSKVSFNDMVIKAVAASLRKHPKLNASWLGDSIRYHDQINIGVAVAVDDGLLVPVVRNADTKGMSTISAEVREYAEKARDKKLQPHEWEGNTFTVSNLGMFGVEEFTAIMNPPDACILAIGGIKQTPVVKNGEIVPGNVMKVTLSCDHRVVDGAMGAAFLQTFKAMLEDPMRILL